MRSPEHIVVMQHPQQLLGRVVLQGQAFGRLGPLVDDAVNAAVVLVAQLGFVGAPRAGLSLAISRKIYRKLLLLGQRSCRPQGVGACVVTVTVLCTIGTSGSGRSVRTSVCVPF